MSKICKVVYIPEEKKTSIIFDGKEVDCSRIQSKRIQDWVSPFLIKGIRWRGFLQEMKTLNDGSDDFVVQFDGSDEHLHILETSLEGSNVRVVNGNNSVVVFYRAEPLMTRITINGKAFDASRLEGRTIDEYVDAFEVGNIKWQGLFKELENFIGINEYSIQFVGDKQYMIDLIEMAPDTVSITHKEPVMSTYKKNHIQAKIDAVHKEIREKQHKNILLKIWFDLGFKLRCALCGATAAIAACIVLIICLGNFGSYSDYYYLVKDAVVWSFDEDKENREDAKDEILENMPIGKSDMFWFNDEQIKNIRQAKDYSIGKIKIKKENVGSAQRDDSYISPEYMYAHWGIEDDQVKAFLKFEVTVEMITEIKGNEKTTVLVGTGYMIEPKEEYRKSWSAFVTGIQFSDKKED